MPCSACVSGGMDQRRSISGKMTGGQFLKVTIIMVGMVRVNMLCQAEIVRKTGKNLLSDPLFNKGLGFPRTERDRLGIRGLVPPSTYVIKISTRNIENISFKI